MAPLRVLFLLICLLLISPLQSQEARCDCEPSLRHLCRCGVLIEQELAEVQLAYLNRLLLAEYGSLLDESPVTSVALATDREMLLEGESAQGYFDNGEIILNNTLRRDKALMVLAHELGHAWQYEIQEDPDEVDEFLAEGFAEWVAFYLMKRAGLTEHCYALKTNPDPIYGEGLRWFLNMEQEFGREAVMKIVTTWQSKNGNRQSREIQNSL